MQPQQFIIKWDIFLEKLKKSQNIYASFVLKFIATNFQKSPNLVTLPEPNFEQFICYSTSYLFLTTFFVPHFQFFAEGRLLCSVISFSSPMFYGENL